MKTGMLKKMIATVCVAAMATSCVIPHVGAVKIVGGASRAAGKRICELNKDIDEYFDKLNKIKESIKRLKLKVKGENERVKLCLNTVLREIDTSISSIKTLDNVLLGDLIFNIDMQNDLNNLSRRLRVLGYLVRHCQWNSKGNTLEIMKSNGIGLEENAELLPDEIDKVDKEVEESSVGNVLLQYAVKTKDGLNTLKNKLTRVADNGDNKTTNRKEKSNLNGESSKNKEIFDMMDKLYSNRNEKSEEKTVKTIDILKKTFPKEDARLRAMMAFDVINKYKEQGIQREAIIKELVEPVVREEMEQSFKRCRENVSSIISKKIDDICKERLINHSISLAVESNANSLYEFCYVAFYGNGERLGFYNWLDRIKIYFYNKYQTSRDSIVLPVIVDIVELNSLALRLEELEHIGCNADNIRKTSKIFDKIFNDRVDGNGNIVSEGMYSYLAGQSYKSHIDRNQKYFGQYQLLHEMNCDFMDFVNSLLIDNDNETFSDIKEKTHKSVEKFKDKVKQVDDKYSKLGIEFDIPGFTPESKKTIYNMQLDFYKKMIDYEKWKTDNNLDNLYDLNNSAIVVMANFRKNKYKAQYNKLTSEEFIKSLEESQSHFNEQIKKVQQWQSYHKYRSELHRFLYNIEYYYPEIRMAWTNMFCEDSIFVSIMSDAEDHYSNFVQDSSSQNISKMEEISHRAITDMRNIRQNRFILEHEQRVKRLEDNFESDIEEDEEFRCAIAGRALAKKDEFRKYYEENRYDLSEEKINHLKNLADEFKELLLQFGL